MSKVSDCFDALLTRITAVLPDHKRLTNPYALDENSERILNKAVGLAFGPGVNTKRMVDCQLSVERTFNITITRVVRANEHNISVKDNVAKQLFEDLQLIVNDIEADPTLGSASVAKSDFLGDNGITFVFTEKDNFLAIEANVSVEYFEDLT